MEEKSYPLILVFYLDADLLANKEIREPFMEAVNKILHEKNANIIAFFLPTKGEEHIDCINPLTVPKEEMEKIHKIIDDIKINFSIE